MNFAELVFGIFAGLALIGGFGAVWFKNVFYNALFLILCLFGVAGLFIFLNSEFLAVMEIVVYIGAISIAIIFAIMLSKTMVRNHVKRDIFKYIRSAVIAFLFGYGVFGILRNTQWPKASVEGDYSIRSIGKSLLTEHVLPFEVISIILLVAIIGALVISEKQKDAS